MIRRLAGPAAVLGAVLAFYLIAPDPVDGDPYRTGAFARNTEVRAANRRVWHLGDTVRALNAAVQRAAAWERARSLAPDPAPTKLIMLPGIEPRRARAFEQDVRAEFAALGVPRVPVRIVLLADSQLSAQYRKSTVIPQHDSQPCVVVVAISGRGRADGAFEDDRLLGTCAFYAKFGQAGSGMRAWLEASRGIAAGIDTALPRTQAPRTLRKLTGGLIGQLPAEAACLAGNDDGCAESVLSPLDIRSIKPIVPPSERTAGVFVSFNGSNRYGPGSLLAEMREFVGDQRFEQIWTSSEDPATAFKTATGEHIAVFARPILLREALPHEPGPMRSGLPLLLSLGVGATAAALAITRTRRERSGS